MLPNDILQMLHPDIQADIRCQAVIFIMICPEDIIAHGVMNAERDILSLRISDADFQIFRRGGESPAQNAVEKMAGSCDPVFINVIINRLHTRCTSQCSGFL